MVQATRGMGQQAPSGFNYTKHNCNTSSRQRKPYCGRLTLIGRKEGKYAHHRFRCKSYACGHCGPRKLRLIRKRIVKRAVIHRLQRFLTLTLDPKKLPPETTTLERIKYLWGVWRKMRVSLERKLGKPLAFIGVVELQRNRNP